MQGIAGHDAHGTKGVRGLAGIEKALFGKYDRITYHSTFEGDLLRQLPVPAEMLI